MRVIKNARNKTVCCVDPGRRVVEIKKKSETTIIRFLDNGKVKVINQ